MVLPKGRTRMWSIDHVVPQHLGGTNRLKNLVFACYDCNHRKGHLHPLVWIAQHFS